MTETQGALLADRYRLVEQLGRGGMGVVWRAHDEVFNREVAVKEVLLPAELPREERENVIGRTLREARVAAKLSHPNVVKVYDVVRAGGRPWIVMELVQAQSLTELIEQYGPLPPAEVARIGLQVLAALGAAHGAGINHRDVKPGNVLCTDAGRVVLTDFGIASLEGDNTATSTGPLMGSPSYIAPERVRGRAASPASDLWSLAATLYAAVEGRPPYDRDGIVETVTAVVNEEPDPFRLAGPLAAVLHRMFQKDPAERPSAAQTRIMLREVAGAANHREEPVEDQPQTALAVPSWPAPTSPAPPRYADATFVNTGGQLATPNPDGGAADTTDFGAALRIEPVHPVVAAIAGNDGRKPPARRGPRRAQVVLVGVAVLAVLGGGAAVLRALNTSGDKIPSASSKAALEESSPAPSESPSAEAPDVSAGAESPAVTTGTPTTVPSTTGGDTVLPPDPPVRKSPKASAPPSAKPSPSPVNPPPAPSPPPPSPSPEPPSPSPAPAPAQPPTVSVPPVESSASPVASPAA